MLADPLLPLRASLASGDFDTAGAMAADLAARGELRQAQAAYQAIGDVCSSQRATAAGKLGDLCALLGDRGGAIDWFERARSFGAPPDWVDARRRWLDTAGAGDAFVGRAARDPGAWNQKGVVVLRPSYVAFVPTHARTHVAAIAAKALVAFAGVLVVEGRQIQAAHIKHSLDAMTPGQLDHAVPELTRQSGGVCYRSDQARFRFEKLPLGVRMSFVAPGDRVMVLDAKVNRNHPTFRRLVAHWPTDS